MAVAKILRDETVGRCDLVLCHVTVGVFIFENVLIIESPFTRWWFQILEIFHPYLRKIPVLNICFSTGLKGYPPSSLAKASGFHDISG